MRPFNWKIGKISQDYSLIFKIDLVRIQLKVGNPDLFISVSKFGAGSIYKKPT